MNIRYFFMIVFLGFFAVSTANAAGVDDTRPAEFKHNDQQLNKTYQILINRLSSEDKRKLQNAQRAWLKFRDIDCEWAYSAEKYDCLIDRTANRNNELESTLFFDSKGNYGSLK